MRNPILHQTLVLVSLIAAGLACARADIPITPASVAVFTPAAAGPQATRPPAAAASPTAAPPSATATPELPPTETPTGVAVFPTATFTPEPPTDTPAPPTPTQPPTATSLAPVATATAAPTNRPAGPTATLAPVGGIPANATFTQKFAVSNQGGNVVGRPVDMTDGRTVTWASLRGGNASWVLDLGSRQNLAGLRFWAQPDGGEPTALLSVEVSPDGNSWTRVYAGSGSCDGTPNCDFVPQREYVDFGFGPLLAQYLRLNGGPTRFAFAELLIAVVP